MEILKVIDRSVFRFIRDDKDEVQDELIITRPGYVEGEVYYPAESVTLWHDDLLSELRNLVHEIEKEWMTNGTTKSAKCSDGIVEGTGSILGEPPQDTPNPVSDTPEYL